MQAKTVPQFHRQLFQLPLKAADGTAIVCGMEGIAASAQVNVNPGTDAEIAALQMKFVVGQPFGVYVDPLGVGNCSVTLQIYRSTSFGGTVTLGSDQLNLTITNNPPGLSNGTVTDAPVS